MTALADTPIDSPLAGGAVLPIRPVLLHRLRLLAVCLALSALAFVQDPGFRAADTKLDLLTDPSGFLQRALHLWEPLGFFGQLQNQAYGYLFPMGPFFVLGDLSGLPMWVVQRLWWSLLLCAAFLGMVRLTRLLGVRWPAAAMVAGLAYALAPRMVTELGVLSVEVLPYAMAPWVLVPLVSAARSTMLSPRRAAMLSGIAIACTGGVNAVASAAVWPLAAWWILTSFRGRVRVIMLGWWLLAVALATAWWILPLALLGRYSPPFLDWIESSSVTTLVTSPDTVLRGTSQWVAYVADGGGPVWPSGWQLVTSPVLILATAGVAALGLAGLSLRSTPWRLFLLGGVLLGWVLVSWGHVGEVSGPGADELRALLDAGLAPLRNTHKFDVLLRLPLAVGIGLALQAAAARIGRGRRAGRDVILRRTGVGMATALVLLSAWPAVTGSLTRGRSYADVPGYWSQVADWLAQAKPAGTALLVPGASFGVYSWGRSQDEPLQPLATTPWAVRDAVPLSSAGNIRWLDAIQERLDSGRGSPGLADALARAGVRYVVVRNDIDRRRSDTPRSILVRQALVRSGGFTPVAGFGPVLPPYRSETMVVDDGLQDASVAVEIWRVDSPYAAPDARVTLRDAADVLVTSGSAEALLDLADAEVLQGRAVVTAGDDTSALVAAGAAMADGVTDTFLRTELNVGRSRANRSQALSADDGWLIERRVHDYLAIDPAGRQTLATFSGGRALASSSGSDAAALRGRDPAAQPWAAIDGDPSTAWVSGDLAPGVGQWWEFLSDDTLVADTLTVRLLVGDIAGIAPSTITVTTDAGQIDVAVAATDQPQRIPLPAGPTHRLRLTLASVVDGSPGEGFGLSEVDIPTQADRRLIAPGLAAGGPIVLTARRGEQAGCVTVSGQLACSSSLAKVGEERAGLHRRVAVETTGDYRVRMRVRPRTGARLDNLLAPLAPEAPQATASSQLSRDPAVRPQAAVDGSLETAWVASPLDTRPTLTIEWSQPRTIRGVRLLVRPELAASRPLTVTVDAGGPQTRGVVSTSGLLRIPPRQTRSLSITFDNVSGVRSLDPLTGSYTQLPVGVNEVRLLGAEDLPRGPRPTDTANVPCGFGPSIVVSDGRTVRTSVEGTVGSMLTDQPLVARPCDGQVIRLSTGAHDVDVASTAEFVPESVVFEPVVDVGVRPLPQSPEIVEWKATDRVVDVPGSDEVRLLELAENANPGWVATLDGTPLPPVRVDGWRQAWVVPEGAAGRVTMAFAPDAAYRAALAGGLAALVGLLALAFSPVRRRRPSWQSRENGGTTTRAMLAIGGVVSGLAVAGWPGFVVALVAYGLCIGVRRWWVVALTAIGAGLAACSIPWPTTLSGSPEVRTLAALLAVGAVCAACSPWDRAMTRLLRWRQPGVAEGIGPAPDAG